MQGVQLVQHGNFDLSGQRHWRNAGGEGRDTGAMLVGRGSTGAEITVLALSGCLMDKGMSSNCSVGPKSVELLTGLSSLSLAQTRFLVDGSDRWGGC